MTMRVDVYIAGGMARGGIAGEGHLREALDATSDLALEHALWQGPDDPAARPIGPVTIPVDDIIVAVTDDDPSIPVHAVWHPVHLEAGPYVVDGEIPTLPGFDPGRALTRPAGSFVLLRDVRLARSGSWPVGVVTCREALVNRYLVERVEAELMLGFFFPGAAMEPGEPDRLDAPSAAVAPTTANAPTPV